MNKHLGALCVLIGIGVFISYKVTSAKRNNEIHHAVFSQMHHLREVIIKFQSNNDCQPSSLEEVARFDQLNLACILPDGKSFKWKFNANSNMNDDWLIAAPMTTEQDGIRGVWVLTKNMSLQVWSPDKTINASR